MQRPRVAVLTGGRDYGDRAKVLFVVELLAWAMVRVRVGDCSTGLDRFVRESGSPFVGRAWVADWDTHGRAAGPLRNRAMLVGERDGYNEGRADIVVAFLGGRGTADCVRQARQLGIPVVLV